MADTLTPEKIRKIAQEAAKEEVSSIMQNLESKIDSQGQMLEKLYRVLLGEEGMPEEETLSYRARMAHDFARSNVNVVEEVIPMLAWFKLWDKPQPGCKESYFQKLGKMIRFYDRISWLIGIIGIVSVFNAIPVIKWIVELVT